jgi:hypothetical protein
MSCKIKKGIREGVTHMMRGVTTMMKRRWNL